MDGPWTMITGVQTRTCSSSKRRTQTLAASTAAARYSHVCCGLCCWKLAAVRGCEWWRGAPCFASHWTSQTASDSIVSRGSLGVATRGFICTVPACTPAELRKRIGACRPALCVSPCCHRWRPSGGHFKVPAADNPPTPVAAGHIPRRGEHITRHGRGEEPFNGWQRGVQHAAGK